MKKSVLMITFAVAIAIVLSGCANDEMRGYEMKALYDEYDATLPYQVTASGIQNDRTIVLNGSELKLSYVASTYYPIGCRTLHKYAVDGDAERQVMLDDDGNLEMILYSYATISISPTDRPSDVAEALKAELAKLFDMSKYQLTETPTEGTDDLIHYYKFCRKKGDCITDKLLVTVKSGAISGVTHISFGTDDVIANIDQSKQTAAIEQKIKNGMSDGAKFVSFELHGDPSLVTFEQKKSDTQQKELYVCYALSVKFVPSVFNVMGKTVNSFLFDLLIPLETVKAE